MRGVLFLRKIVTMDGNHAAAHVSYAFTDVASIYPITPSSTMAEYVDEWSSKGQKNIFGNTVEVVEMQSEAGAVGAMHGALTAGALGTTYTASQGLLLMIPNMYKMAGEFLPAVIHVTARTLATHALSIFGDHSDVMCCNQTGFIMLASDSVQEVMDLGAVAHLASIEASIPVLHFFDGFRTSHEQQKIEAWDYDELASMLNRDALDEFRKTSLNPERPEIRGTNQNPDIFFQAREASNTLYAPAGATIKKYMDKVNESVGTDYKPFNYYGAPDATDIIVLMGSIAEVAESAIDYINAAGGKVGMIKVSLYRPFVSDFFFDVFPETVRRIAVLDRVKVPGALGEPLYQDIQSLFYNRANQPLIIGGRYGLASKDTVPEDIMAVFSNLASQTPKDHFTLSIIDDVTFTSLDRTEDINMLPDGTIQCKFWGFGSDGTVGANKQAVGIINDETPLYAQAYFSYDSKKSGGLTVSHLRFGEKPIAAPYLIKHADFVSCSNQSYVETYDLLQGLKTGGTFLLNTVWSDDELNTHLPATMRKYIAENDIKFYTMDAVKIAGDLGLGNRTNMVMQAAFFKLANIIPEETAVASLKRTIKKAYGRKGEKIVEMNNSAVDAGMTSLHEVAVPSVWAEANIACNCDNNDPEFIKNVLRPMAKNMGDDLPVSAFLDSAKGGFPMGGSAYEKRGVASSVPEWNSENCIQCNRCSLVCPHAAIRPFLLTAEEVEQAPAGFKTLTAMGAALKDYAYKIQVSPMDCMGCGLCVVTCPSKVKSLEMKAFGTQEAEACNWDYVINLPEREVVEPSNVKNSQFKKPLLEFSGACAGCGETPYAKLITQLFGDRMLIANATGCSSIWGAAVPAMPYTTNSLGHGPAWSNSLFEDNAEFGLGMYFGVKNQRENLLKMVNEAIEANIDVNLTSLFKEWVEVFNDGDKSKAVSLKIAAIINDIDNELIREIAKNKEFFTKKSVWAFGGDGWAYDIGFGGLDHVLASGEDINVFVFDTEVYSNTGGQSSKSTPTAAVAKFAASGKRTKKKDLGMMAMSYGYVYVAQIAMGADMNQTLKAIKEAEAYPGPSLVIAYSSCINHGIREGMSHCMVEMQRAVDCGYWQMYRYNPMLEDEGKNPFSLDSKAPTGEIKSFLKNEVRYSSLAKIAPEIAEDLFEKTEKDALKRCESYSKLV